MARVIPPPKPVPYIIEVVVDGVVLHVEALQSESLADVIDAALFSEGKPKGRWATVTTAGGLSLDVDTVRGSTVDALGRSLGWKLFVETSASREVAP